MMRTWNEVRAEFNHAWLKNRVLIALCKAQNVLAGTVEDEAIWEDLEGLMKEWEERRGEAERILAEFPQAASPVRELDQALLSNLDPEIKGWLGQVVEQRWSKVEHTESRASRAANALRAFDHEVQTFSSIVAAVRDGQEATGAKARLTIFQAATKELAEALSELAPAGV
jgi:hypothetical protein